MHVADTIEVFSREHEGITEGRAYELVYFIDEGVSHYIQFVSLFFVIGWFVIFDRAGRTAHASLALFLGAAHGVERGLGTIEGEKWYAVPVLVLWVAGAARLRHRRVGRHAFGEFFFRYALVFVAMVPVFVKLGVVPVCVIPRSAPVSVIVPLRSPRLAYPP